MRLSVLMAGAGDAPAMRRTLASLERSAVDWELRVAGPPGGVPASARVHAVPTGARGAAAYEACLAASTGDVVMLLAPGDEVEPAVLARAVAALAAQPGCELVYADEDRVDAAGARHDPILRPDWSPDYLLSALYVDRAFVARRRAVAAAGGFAGGDDAAPDWDLVLRLAERAPFARVVGVLLHRPGRAGAPWRPDDAALVAAGRRAVEAACRRRGIVADVVAGAIPGTYRVRRPAPAARVSVVVPFRDGAALLGRCVRGVLATGGDVPVEIVLVDNDSVEPATAALLDELGRRADVRLVRAPGAFNFSALVNAGAAAASGDVLCLLNNDVEPLATGWLGALAAEALRPEIGAVGAKLLYPDGSVQHAGIATGLFDETGHVHRFAPGDAPGYLASAAVVREVSAVTGACLAVRRQLFLDAGGLDVALPGAYNDVDFCLRLWARGLRVLFTPDARLVHHEGAARGREDVDRPALALMRQRWGRRLREDPFHHPGLARDDETVRPSGAPAAPGWAARQRRRLRWLADDVVTWWADRRAPAGDDPPLGLALLAGGPLATRGQPNRYRLRVHHRGAAPLAVQIDVRGSAALAGHEAAFAASFERTLAAEATLDLTCETDWAAGFTVSEAAALPGGPAPRPADGRCELTATIRHAGGAAVARIAQPLAG